MRNILFQVSTNDRKFLPLLKPIFGGRANISLNDSTPLTVTEVAMRAKQKGANAVVTTNAKFAQILLQTDKLPSLDDYAGSVIEKQGVEFLILNPVEHLITVPYGKHLYERFLSKFLHPEDWLQLPDFSWEIADVARQEMYLDFFSGCNLIAIDIETSGSEDTRHITCISFTGVIFGADEIISHTVCFPFTLDNLQVIRRICDTPVSKIFQNGKYDNIYLLRFNCTVRNWSLDTAHMFHAWLTELPKRLDFIAAYTLRKWQFWKDEAKTTNLEEYYAYNAKDAFATAMACIALLREMPPWAMANYKMEFPLVFPCLQAELTGLRVDMERMARLRTQMQTTVSKYQDSARKLTATPTFNPGSSKQVARLFVALGSGDIVKTTPANMDKVENRHPLNRRILTPIKAYRKDNKLLTTYLVPEKVWLGRIFYSLNPHGTDTGRLASKESAFWCGLQIHNQPRDRDDISIKEMYIADEGFEFGEADYEQAEARDTAYLSGDTALISAVDSPADFHATNAAAFFGVPYDKIVTTTIEKHNVFDDAGKFIKEVEEHVHKVIDKALRDLAKRVNHGSNYNMGEAVLVDTMGIANIMRAQKLLNLPVRWGLRQVAAFLLETYAKTYPGVKGPWYDHVKYQVKSTQMLVGPTGWTRFCFGNPDRSKQALNSYVAHPPQSLNAMTLNKAWLRVFSEIALKYPKDFKLCAQIHDSILFQYRKGRLDLVEAVKKCMEIPIDVVDCLGIKRTLLVPVAVKCGADRWSDIEPFKLAA